MRCVVHFERICIVELTWSCAGLNYFVTFDLNKVFLFFCKNRPDATGVDVIALKTVEMYQLLGKCVSQPLQQF